MARGLAPQLQQSGVGLQVNSDALQHRFVADDLDTAFRGEDKVVSTDIQDREGVLPSIKSCLGKAARAVLARVAL